MYHVVQQHKSLHDPVKHVNPNISQHLTADNAIHTLTLLHVIIYIT